MAQPHSSFCSRICLGLSIGGVQARPSPSSTGAAPRSLLPTALMLPWLALAGLVKATGIPRINYQLPVPPATAAPLRMETLSYPDCSGLLTIRRWRLISPVLLWSCLTNLISFRDWVALGG